MTLHIYQVTTPLLKSIISIFLSITDNNNGTANPNAECGPWSWIFWPEGRA